MVEWLERLFPGLRGTVYRITSPPTDKYNCIAWAVGVTDAWWWPVSHQGKRIHWPTGAASVETLDAFRDVLDLLGFVPCDGEQFEAGFEKVALFADAQQTPTHAARQLPAGYWTSKLGQGDDIEHDLHALEGDIYGKVVLVLKRPLPGSTPASG
jgi:hypothetical protein